MPERPPTSERVKVALDVDVPPRFGPHDITLDDKGGQTLTVAHVEIEMIDGKPEFIRLDIGIGDVADRTSPTISPEQLAAVDWHKAAWDAVTFEAWASLAEIPNITPERWVRGLDAVVQAAADVRRYNRVNTRTQLDQVAELWHRGGPEAVRQHFNVSRRQADRYVKRARDAGAL